MPVTPLGERGTVFLAGGGEMGALMRAHDWARSPLGPPETWPAALRTAIGLMLGARQPVYVAWGAELTSFYNDGYLPIVGAKHPGLGKPFVDLWAEIWEQFRPIVEATMAGDAQHFVDLPIPLAGRPGLPMGYFTFSYTALRDEKGDIAGFYCAATETTDKVLAERRQAFLLELGDRLHTLGDAGAIMQAAAEALGRHIGADRAGYAEVAADDETFVVERDWAGGGMASFAGRHRLDDFGSDLIAAFRAGQTVAFEDVLNEPLTAGADVAQAFETITMRAAVTVPLVKNGRFSAALYVHARLPRRWAAEDEALVRYVAERTWAAVERARAEAELRESEARFRALATVGSSSIYRMGPDWGEMRHLDGAGFLADTEASTTDWIGTYIPAGEQPKVGEAIDRAIRAKGVFELEHRIRRADGTIGWTLSRAVPLLNEVGEITEWLGAASDVTERVKADQSFNRLFQASPAPFLVLAPDAPRFTIMEVNDAYLAATMTTRESIVGRGVFEAFPDNPDDPTIEGVSTLRASLERVLATRQPDTLPDLKYDIAKPTGGFEERYWSPVNTAVLDDHGEVEAIIHNANDVTDERRVGGALRASEARLRELNETLEQRVAERSAERDRLWNLSQDMLARADYSGMMSAVSPAWTHVLGWSETELLTREYATFMHPDDVPPTLEVIAHMAETHQPTRFENRIATRDGGWKPIEWTVAPEPDGVNFIAVGRDLSLAKAREAELELAQEALRQSQKMEAMGSLTGGVAHDFNNLLTPIVGSLDMLQRKGFGGEREQRLIAGAIQSADRAKTLVQRLLAFARRQPLQATAVDLSPLVRGMADLISSTTGPQIKVMVDAPEGLPPAKADPNQLEMAILNLAVNARDAMPEGGTLRISVDAETVGRQHRADITPGRYLRLSVADTGEGMDETTLKRAVEPFFSTKGIGKGTGLGLSMVHGLASQLGGALTIHSTRGVGTNIELWLPQSAEPTAAVEPTADAPLVARGSGTALLVDDEDLVRLSTADMLIELGYAVVEASSAEEALKLIDRGLQPDLLVTDHLMPGMSGTELARTLQHMQPRAKVIIVSGYAEAEGVAPDLPRLTKPFRNADLAASLAGLS
ncbi:PAS domain-containing protein [Sphingoaurantiacus capsulatus]|uniref:histidine kinase n=1 Tax=Sphingoaurantiacus capsulatus TaxID=1771310 RepID=A0ABV7XB52_9SPHN